MDELAESGDVLGHVAFVDQVGRVDPNEELVEDDEEDDQLDEGLEAGDVEDAEEYEQSEDGHVVLTEVRVAEDAFTDGLLDLLVVLLERRLDSN